MSNQIQLIEDAIIARLKQSFPALDVRPFPEQPKQYRLLHPQGALLVQYDSSKFSDHETLAVVTQQKDYKFTITSMLRNLRQHNGVYEVLSGITLALLGFELPGYTKFRQTSEAFLFEDAGIWAYTQSFETRGLIVEEAYV